MKITVLAPMAGLLSLGTPLFEAWDFLLQHEGDASTKKLLEKFKENWVGRPPDQAIRVSPTIEELIPSPDREIVYPLTWIGEVTGSLDSNWYGALALLSLRKRLRNGGALTSEDIHLFHWFSGSMNDESLDGLNWKSWSNEPAWENLNSRQEVEFYNREKLSTWFKANARGDVSPVSQALEEKFRSVGEMIGSRELAEQELETVRYACSIEV